MIERNNQQPLYLQIRNDIADKIDNGSIRIGDKLMSENEMIEFYGVGRVTIRAALAALVAEGCLKKEHGLGTFCIAKPKMLQRPNIDVLLDCNDTYLIPSILQGINSIFEANNCNLLLHDTCCSCETMEMLLRKIVERGTNGVIIQYCPNAEKSENIVKCLNILNTFDVPVVVMCGELTKECSTLAIDDEYGGRMGCEYLIDCGHVSLLGVYPKGDFGAEERLAGAKKVLRKHPGVRFSLLYEDIVSREEFAANLLGEIGKNGVTALLCYNDFYAARCMHVLQEAGLRVPEDVSVIGFDDNELSLTVMPQLTTLSHPKDHMGIDAAATILMQIKEKRKLAVSTVYRPEVVIRQTVLNKSDPERD